MWPFPVKSQRAYTIRLFLCPLFRGNIMGFASIIPDPAIKLKRTYQGNRLDTHDDICYNEAETPD